MKEPIKIFLNKAPFLKLLIPLIAGIIFQSKFNNSISVAIVIICLACLGLFCLALLPSYQKLKYSWLKTIFISFIILALGMFLYLVKDTTYKRNWFGHFYEDHNLLTVSLIEKPVEKENSYQAETMVNTVMDSLSSKKTSGKIIIYFKKDSLSKQFKPGTKITFKKNLQKIKNSGNPGGFDYKRYALYNGITHTVYLTQEDFIFSSQKYPASVNHFLSVTRERVIQILKKYIPGKKEQGLAEALLIGYKDDLDPDLLQSYTNTGVVHVIAVSGMHLALIFWLLNLLFKPLLKRKKTAWLHPVLIISILWIFTLVAGGAASIVRAAVMFTFILLGTAFNRKASIYNTLAASSFLLLCYNPYWLWDVGFQLSYTAVLSIVIFYKPLYHLLFIKNKILDSVWQLAAVSVAAQILTLPVVLYHFHQFPLYFLITNLLVVPVSSAVLIGELLLVAISPFKFLANVLGKALSAVIWWMNSFIEQLEKFPYAIIDGIQIDLSQTILLFILIGSIALLLIQKIKIFLWLAFGALAFFMLINAYSFYIASNQRRLIIYNISKHDAVDFINGRNYQTMMDSSLYFNKKLTQRNLKPARTFYRVKSTDSLAGLSITNSAITYLGKRILFVNKPINTGAAKTKTNVDIVILSQNPRLFIIDLIKVIIPKQIVISGSAPAWKANYWQKDCDSLGIPCHNVSQKGAFVMNLR